MDFLLAEAALKGWNVAGSVEEHYRKGVRAAMDFLTDNYGCDKITDEEFDNYMANNIIGYTVEQKKASINTQAWQSMASARFLLGGRLSRSVCAILCWNLHTIRKTMRKRWSVWEVIIAGIPLCGGIKIMFNNFCSTSN